MFSKVMDFWLTLLGIKPVSATVVAETKPVEVPVVEEAVEEVSNVEPEVVEQLQPVDLKAMTKKQLVEFAAEINVEVDGRKKKDDIIKTIEASLG